MIFKPGATADIADKATVRHHSSSVRTFESISHQRQRLHRHIRSGTLSTAALIAELKNDPDVELAEPNYRRKSTGMSVPNDAEFTKLWGLRNTGQTVNGHAGTAGADIRFIDAWAMAKADSREIVVAVLDSGMDLTHPDLAANIWTNRGEIAGDGLDNDGNGRVDDVHGYDFSSNDADPSDFGLHGSHVSGIIAGVANNSLGIVGAAYHAHIMPLKISPDGDSIDTAAELAALDYVVMMKNRGVNIVAINASYGGSGNSTSENNAIQAAGDAGIVFCAAAGNESSNNTATPIYPANHRLPNMIVVAASDSNDRLASFSNYGSLVDLAAPGVDIYSTIPQSGGTLTGSLTRGATSYAAIPLEYSGATPGITATVYDCGLGNPADFPAAVRNNIALIQRGTLLFSEKVTNAMNAGAKAVIIYNNVAGMINATLGSAGTWIPAHLISQADGQALLGVLPATVTLASVVTAYAYESGTSMAAPYVTAAVAFAARSFPNETAAQRVARILNNVTHVASLAGQVITGGRLNLAGIVDTDANGLPDWWEMENFGHIGVDPAADPDRDGITNLEQYLIATGQAFKLAHSTLENGQITGVGVYLPESTAILTATANAGYVFSGWTGDAAGTANPLLMPMNSNKTVGATFRPLSTVSTLSGLTLGSGPLSPAFAPTTATYTASVANTTTAVTVTPTVTDPTATVKVNGEIVASGTASAPIPLVAGFNPITVLVIAQDGTTTTTYTVTVLRISNDSTLAGLTVSTGALSPVFAPGTTAYAASTTYTTTSLTVTPTTNHAAATLTINGTPLASGATSLPIPLVVGPNTIEVKVTAEDETISTYTVTVTRPPLYAAFTSATSVGLTSSGYTATGNTLSLSLGYAPTAGTHLAVINNTGLGFITGRFSNLAQGQAVALTYNGVTYQFIANYHGGTGNDLVLQWANTKTYAWGYNNQGQLGNSTTTTSKVPISVTGTGVLNGKTVISVSCGASHSLALCADGTVAAWGYNASGQLGNGLTTHSSVPVAASTSGVLLGKTVIAVAAGNSHSLALCSDGTLATWGYNLYGELGNGGSANSSIPVDITTSGVLSAKSVVAIAAGWSHSLALCSDGTVAAWGYNADGQLGNTTTGIGRVPAAVSGVLSGKAVASISAGSDHTLALCVDGTVAAWGYNNQGQLGDNSKITRTAPVAVSTAGGLLNKTVTAVAAGGSHSLALCSDGTVAAWGYNVSGQLGNNSSTSSSLPVAVSTSVTLLGKFVVRVSSGSSHSLAQCSDGTLAAWGDNTNGQLGNTGIASTSNVPVAVSAAALGAGGRFMTMATGPKAMHSVAVVPVSTHSSLAGLAVGSGSLSPAFSPATISYLSNVPGSTASVTVTPTSSDPAASVKVNGTTVASGSASGAISLGSSAVNTITVVVMAQDGVTSTTYSVTIDNTPLGIWRKTGFTDPADLADPAISGDLATPARDGITNLMKYALALEPMACGTGNLPTAAPQDGYLTLTYRKSKTATDVTYTVQAADSLDGNAWTPATTVLSQTDGGNCWLVTVRDTVPYAGQARRFMRLQVGK